MAKRGRPTKYSKALADRLCQELSLGISLRTVCIDDKMPCIATVFNWMRTKPNFLEQYARAKQESADAMAEEILDIADDGTNDWMEIKRGGETVEVPNNEVLQRSKLRVDTRKWLMSKMKPKKYGEKIDVMSDGKAIEGNTIVFKNFSGTQPSSK